MTDEELPRWRYRFDNFGRALTLLQEAVEADKSGELSALAREGLIRRFEYTFELGWKTMADFLAWQNGEQALVAARSVIRAAFEARLIEDGDGWIEALNDRNESSHVYDAAKFEAIGVAVVARHVHLLTGLHDRLMREAA